MEDPQSNAALFQRRSVYATHKEVQHQLKHHNHPSLPQPAYFRIEPTNAYELDESKEETIKAMANETNDYVMKQKERHLPSRCHRALWNASALQLAFRPLQLSPCFLRCV